MVNVKSPKKIANFLSVIAICVFGASVQAKTPSSAEAANIPADWHAQTPHHLLSTHATFAPGGVSPAQIKQAYGFPAALQGAGQTIAIVDAYDNPNIEADLNTFSAQFGLPACTTANRCFSKAFPTGVMPASDVGWGTEIALDVEWAHAIAPLAKIILVESLDNGSRLFDAVQFAVSLRPTVISLSWGSTEWSGEWWYDQNYFQPAQIPIVAASGDSGNGIWYPSSSPYVTAAGGTELTKDANGNYISETAWSGSGGGYSTVESEPVYQSIFPIANNPGKFRGVPDVSYAAGGGSAYAVYDSFGYGGWINVYGTSAAAPQWAGLIAIMKAAKNGNFANFNGSMYSVGRTTSLWHDIMTGQNGSCGYACQARSGYDYVTGIGSPQALNLINRFK